MKLRDEAWAAASTVAEAGREAGSHCKTQQTTPPSRLPAHISMVTMLMWSMGQREGRFGDFYRGARRHEDHCRRLVIGAEIERDPGRPASNGLKHERRLDRGDDLLLAGLDMHIRSATRARRRGRHHREIMLAF